MDFVAKIPKEDAFTLNHLSDWLIHPGLHYK